MPPETDRFTHAMRITSGIENAYKNHDEVGLKGNMSALETMMSDPKNQNLWGAIRSKLDNDLPVDGPFGNLQITGTLSGNEYNLEFTKGSGTTNTYFDGSTETVGVQQGKPLNGEFPK